MPVIYSAVKRFDPTCGAPWQKFIEWTRLTQLREVVSLDLMLCPNVFQELIAEDVSKLNVPIFHPRLGLRSFISIPIEYSVVVEG